MSCVPLVWTNDDVGVGLADKLAAQVDFLGRFGIPGTFFVVPRKNGVGIDQDADLMRTIERARNLGHEFYQHGLDHTPFDSGVPELWMLDFAPEVRQQYDLQRLEIEKQHTLQAMVRTIGTGQRIWRKAFGQDSSGFRSPWGGFCNALYEALEALGFEWVSSRIPNPASWLRSNGQTDAPMTFRQGVPTAPTRIGGLTEYMIGGDYGFRVPDDLQRISAMVDLGEQEMAYLRHRGWPMLMVSHYHGLEYGNNAGYRVYEQLLKRLLDIGHVQPMSMSQLNRWVAADPSQRLT